MLRELFDKLSALLPEDESDTSEQNRDFNIIMLLFSFVIMLSMFICFITLLLQT